LTTAPSPAGHQPIEPNGKKIPESAKHDQADPTPLLRHRDRVANGSGTITSNLKGEDTSESEEEGRERVEFNRMIDGTEALILAAACEGIDIAAPAFARAIITAVDAAGNNA
jgi:hypothetical protein